MGANNRIGGSMKKFKVKASYVMYVDTIIEAHDLDEAKDIAYEMDGGDFVYEGKGDWNIDAITEEK
jgi:hypothetical protein